MAPISGVRARHALPGVLAAVIESDRRYFELGATTRQLAGSTLAWIPGLTAGSTAVVHRVAPDEIVDPSGWLDTVEDGLRDVGAPVARVYLDAPDARLGAALSARGYQRREEVVFAGNVARHGGEEIELVPVSDADGWRAKQRFHEETPETPDGHDTSADEWVEMERAKQASGELELYLAQRSGTTVGVIGAMRVDEVLRGKNVVTHARHRRRGVGTAMLAGLARVAEDEGRELCVFAVAGDIGERLYRACGMRVAGCQIEWSRTLSPR